MSLGFRCRRIVALVCAAPIGVLSAAQAWAMAHFDIPAQPLADSLRAIGSQTSTNILFDPPLVAGRQAPAVKADLTTDQALSHLLVGTDIQYKFLNDTTVVLATPSADVASSGANGSAASRASVPAEQPQEGKNNSSDRFRLSQVGQGASSSASPIGSDATGGPPGTRTQEEQQAGQQDQFTEVVVTGSRVIREGMSSPTPVTSLSADELLQANPQSLVQGLAELPAFAASTTPKSIGGRTTLGPGNYLNLRDLGPNRNLVLLDGRRVVPSNVAGYVDINLLPQSLISNVSVVTGGASAAYGSDAVAGVTNFILNTKYTGFKADFSAGESGHGDGDSYKASLAWGSGFLDDKLHIIASFDWRHSQQAYASNRVWAGEHCALIPVPGVTTTTQSATNPRQTIACGVRQSNSSYGGAIVSGPLVTPNQGIMFGQSGVPEAFNYGALRSANFMVGGDGNFVNDTVNFITPVDNKVGFGHLTYNFSDSVQAFAQVTASRTESYYNQTYPVFNGPTPLTIYSGNPFIPASIQSRMTSLNVPSFALNLTPKSWGMIQADSGFESYDALAGLKGKLGDTWNWDFHYEHGRTQWRLRLPNQISWERLYRATDAVVAPNGTVQCGSALLDPARYGNCVPLNPFGDGAPSQAALDYIRGNPLIYNVMTQDDTSANITGEPFSLWAGPVSIGAGVEWRRLQGLIESDDVAHNLIDFTGVRGVPTSLQTQVGGWTNTNQLPAGGAYHVTEGFVEVLVPLAKNLPFAQAWDFNAAARYTDYSQSGSVNTWKIGTTWRPISDLLVRLTRSRDIRAPGISDLYSGLAVAPRSVESIV
jgi:iron complex outermembrane recepter protein